MNRGTNLSAPADLTTDILIVAWTVFDSLPSDHLLRADFASALWALEDAVDHGQPVDAALVALVEFVGAVS